MAYEVASPPPTAAPFLPCLLCYPWLPSLMYFINGFRRCLRFRSGDALITSKTILKFMLTTFSSLYLYLGDFRFGFDFSITTAGCTLHPADSGYIRHVQTSIEKTIYETDSKIDTYSNFQFFQFNSISYIVVNSYYFKLDYNGIWSFKMYIHTYSA